MNIVILLAGGKSTRFGSNKMEAKIGKKTVFQVSYSAFSDHPEIDGIVVVGKEVQPGDTRYQSVQNAFSYCSTKYPKDTKILVHNGANPFVSPQEISDVLQNIEKNTAVGVGQKIHGTIRKWNSKSSAPIKRTDMWEMQTPQGAFLSDFLFWSAIHKKKPETITDELCLAEEAGGKTKIIPAHPENKKITTLSDLPMENPIPLTGFGIDSHRFDNSEEKSKKCMLCGVEIPGSPAFLANSDGDVALHALSNAFLSALGEGSFSALADPLCKKGVTESRIYIQKVLKKIDQKKKKIVHISLSFEGKKPKVEKHFPLFRKSLSRLLFITEEQIGLNATTGEGIDGYGKGEGMKVSAVCTLI